MQGVNEVNQKLRLMIDERWYVWQGNKENILRAISRNQHDAKSVENYFVYQNGVAFRKTIFYQTAFTVHSSIIYRHAGNILNDTSTGFFQIPAQK